jgi:hypothetical protein
MSGTTLFLISVIIILAAAWIYLYTVTTKLKKRFEAAFANLDSNQNLADTITTYFEKLGATEQKLKNIETSYKHLSTIGAKSIQKTAVVRFNPFRNTGGDQSFVLALLDNNDSGFLVTSIHSRDGTRVYIKAITYGNSEHNLSKEEVQALNAARQPKEEATK